VRLEENPVPLTKYDELTCHQTVSTFDHPETSERAWTEKIWCHLHDTTGKLALAIGFGVYPNRNVMDGFACLLLDGREQRNLRLSRELRPRIDELAIGPLHYEVLEPYRRIGIRLDESPEGVSFDLEFLGGFQPAEEEPQYHREHGRVVVNTCRYAQLGRARGTITVDGKRIELDPSRIYAQRDHSWGVRMGVGAPEQGVQAQDIQRFRGMMINWATFQLKDLGLTLYLIERADGTVERLTGTLVRPLDDPRPPTPIVAVEHSYQYHERSARMRTGELGLTARDGTRLQLAMRELATLYLRGGAYVGYKGMTHGLWLGPSFQDSERWDLSAPGLADEVHGLDDTICEVRVGAELGYGIIENMILPPFPRYGFPAPQAR
jgi:hypothetical protein